MTFFLSPLAIYKWHVNYIPKTKLTAKEQRETQLRMKFDDVEQHIVHERGGLYDRFENLNVKDL